MYSLFIVSWFICQTPTSLTKLLFFCIGWIRQEKKYLYCFQCPQQQWRQLGIKQCGLENRLNKANMECSWIEFGFFLVENFRFHAFRTTLSVG